MEHSPQGSNGHSASQEIHHFIIVDALANIVEVIKPRIRYVGHVECGRNNKIQNSGQ
jgi:hypothetical protein